MAGAVLASMEIRWFFGGSLPPDVRQWFDQLEPPATSEPWISSEARVDHYLRTGQASLGIKVRSGRLELKWRTQTTPDARLHGQVMGRIERWNKWQLDLQDTDDYARHVPFALGSTIAIEKDRRLRKYELQDGDRVTAIHPDREPRPKQGCNLELTQLGVGGAHWWSLCFEAFGDGTTVETNLLRVVEYVVHAGQPPLLEVADSYGYPEWIRRFGC